MYYNTIIKLSAVHSFILMSYIPPFSCMSLLLLLLPIQNGWTSLHDASDEGHVEVVELLVQYNAQLDIKNRVKLCYVL